MASRVYYYEVSGTREDRDAGKPLETKRIGRENPTIESLFKIEADRAFSEGCQSVKMTYEEL